MNEKKIIHLNSNGEIQEQNATFEINEKWYVVKILKDTHIVLKNYLGRQFHILVNLEKLTLQQLIHDTTISLSDNKNYWHTKYYADLAINRQFTYDQVSTIIYENFEVVQL